MPTHCSLAPQRRLFFLVLMTGVWFLVIVLRLVYLQVFKYKEFSHLAREQQQNSVEISPRRGVIYDRHINELAISVDVNSVYADPREIESPETVASVLSKALTLDKSELVRKLKQGDPDRAFVWIKRKVCYKEEEALRSLQLSGIYFFKEGKRYYPNRDLAAHVLGFVGVDNQGLAGIEYSYDAELRGMPGLVLLNKDAKRNTFFTEIKKPPTNGNGLILNVDKNIQYIVEQELATAMEKTRAIGASMIIMDPQDGKVLAMANMPKFNPNHYEDYTSKVWRNTAVSDSYEPGSTFKVIIASAALEERLAHPGDRVDCQMGAISVRGHVFHDHKKFGVLTVSEIIEKSSDVGAIKLGLLLGEHRLYDYMRSFGIGEKTSIDLPGEHSGLIQRFDKWSKISIGAISFGQEVGVTPLQMLRAVSAIANGGYLVKPYLVNRIVTPSGNSLSTIEPERTRILTRETADTLARMMAGVVERGTGKQAAPDGYTAGGKTGTAQKIINGYYSPTKFIASFVGFAPVENPTIAAVIVIDEPRGLYHGGDVAAPVFRKVAERVLAYLDVPRTREPKNIEPDKPPLAENNVKDLPAPQNEFLESGPSVAREGSEVFVINDSREGSITMPDFRGKSLRDVANECAHLGLELKTSGLGIAVEQIPPPKALVFPGAICNVWFAKPQKIRQLASGQANPGVIASFQGN